MNKIYSKVSMENYVDITITAREFYVKSVGNHRAPLTISGDPEFTKAKLKNLLRYLQLYMEPRPLQRHNKLVSVDLKHSVVLLTVQSLPKDATFFNDEEVCKDDILSRASFLSKIMFGSKIMTSVELIKGYTAVIVSIMQRKGQTSS